MDLNKNGKISKSEALTYCEQSGLNVEQLVADADVDKSGDVSPSEWLAFWERIYNGGISENDISSQVIYIIKFFLDNFA